MKTFKLVFSSLLLMIISVAVALIVVFERNKISDPRTYGKDISQIRVISESKAKSIPKDKVIRYTVYTHADIIRSGKITKKDDVNPHNKDNSETNANVHSDEDVPSEFKRLRNKEFIYDSEFNGGAYATSKNYLIVKLIEADNVVLRAYLKKDPVNGECTNFWYNGHTLTSINTLHTFDARTGKGFSSHKDLVPLIIKEELRIKY